MPKSRKKKRKLPKAKYHALPWSSSAPDGAAYFKVPNKDKPQQLIQTTYYKKQDGKVHALHIGGTIRPFDEERWKRLVIALAYHIHEQRQAKRSDEASEGQGLE